VPLYEFIELAKRVVADTEPQLKSVRENKTAPRKIEMPNFAKVSPHSEQSSQLPLNANDGNAQRQPAVDNLRNFFLTPSTEMFSFFQQSKTEQRFQYLFSSSGSCRFQVLPRNNPKSYKAHSILRCTTTLNRAKERNTQHLFASTTACGIQ